MTTYEPSAQHPWNATDDDEIVDAEIDTTGTVTGTTLVRPEDVPDILTHIRKAGLVNEKADTTRAERWAAGTSAHDRKVRAAYQALEEGRQMVNLNTVLARAETGMHGPRLPRLAMVRADLGFVRCHAQHDGVVTWRGPRFSGWSYSTHDGAHTWSAGGGKTPRWVRGVAQAPLVPPDVRPAEPRKYVLLWEAAWRDVQEHRPRDWTIDPALLEHVTGSLYVVVAAWELTDLERGALGG